MHIQFNDYGKELVLTEHLDWYSWAAEHIAFPNQWKMLAPMRGGIGENVKREESCIGWKKQHVFFQHLLILYMSNPHLLL